MPLVQKNLTPFYWGPKATSRRPRQVEMAVCVRGVFRLRPGAPLEAIEDPIEQGFMTGDVFDLDDVDRAGALRYASDFADWKPNTDLLLKGTCYPPEGSDVVCDAGFGVGDWSKRLRVFGPRTWKPGMVFGGSVSDPEPFTAVPLTWENAYGGPGYAPNPVGKGYAGSELPNVEDPERPVTKVAQKRVRPASFGPVSPLWPERAAKIGTQWGAAWERDRAPFYAEDFDWTYFNAAPADQQLERPLRGDEAVRFENLHPRERVWEARLPGLRLRTLVRDDQGALREVPMHLDTLYADLDAGRLYLTWRGLTPMRELDLTDLASILIASEPLAEDPRPVERYRTLLEAQESDPLGLEEKFPPGFLEVGRAIEAADEAERDGTPPPDLKKLAQNLPAGCPFPPWFLAAAAGDEDPLGVAAQLPAQLRSSDPLGLKDKVPAGLLESDPETLTAGLEGVGKDPAAGAASLERLADVLPPEAADPLRQTARQLREGVAQAGADDDAAAALERAATSEGPAEPPPALEQLEAAVRDAEGSLHAAAQKPEGTAQAQAALGRLRGMPKPDAILAEVLAPLDTLPLPDPPDLPDFDGMLASMKEKLVLDEQKLRGRGIEHPLLGLFALGHRMVDRAPRPGDIPQPDMSGLLGALKQTEEGLLAQGFQPATVAPLPRLAGRIEDLMAKLPPRPPEPERRDYAYQDLTGRDLSGRDLRGKSFARAILKDANLSGADLSGAELTEATLAGADLSGATAREAVLGKATLDGATLPRADLTGATLRGATLQKADLTGATLRGADLEGADLQKAVLPAAVLTDANLVDAVIQAADLTGADLSGAKLEQAKGMKACLRDARLTRADLRFAELNKADLAGASLADADLSIANVDKARLDGADLSRAKLDLTQLTKARLQGAVLAGATASMGAVRGSNLTGADCRGVSFEKVDFSQAVLDEADFEAATLRGCILRDTRAHEASFLRADVGGSSATGEAAFTGCRLVQLEGARSVWMDADLTESDFSHADLTDAVFQGARGEDVNFFAATLKNASLRKARWTRSRFVRADLCGAQLDESLLVDDQFTSANCYDTKFIAARITSCDFLEANLVRARFERVEGEAPA